MQFEKKKLWSLFLVVAGCIFLHWILHEFERVATVFRFVRKILAPFVLGAAFAFILNVPMRGIEKMLKKISNANARRILALALTLLAVLLVLAAVFWLLIPQLVSTIQTLIPKLERFATDSEQSIVQFFNDHPKLMELFDIEKLNISSLFEKMASALANSISGIVGGAFSVIGNISGAVVNILLGFVFAIYCLFQKETLARQGKKIIYAFLPEKWCDEIVRILRFANSTFSNFLSGQCLEVVILGAMFAVGMLICRMPYAPLVSVLVAITAFIPVVGAWVGCVLGAFFMLVENPMQAIWFVVLFIIIQQIENNFIYPRVVGTSIGLSGLWVLAAIAVGGELMGIAGMFIMIPITSVLYTLLAEITNKRLTKRQIQPEKLMYRPPEIEKPRKKKKKGKNDTTQNSN